jgi:hypothetical protein
MPTPPPLDEPGTYQWTTPGKGLRRNLGPDEVDGVNRAQNDRNIRSITLSPEKSDEILGALSKAGVKVLIWDQEEVRKEAGEDVEAEAEEEKSQDVEAQRKKAAARELLEGVKERMRPTREAVEKAKGDEPGTRELLEYLILRIKIAQ